jgi:hypothetical protein
MNYSGTEPPVISSYTPPTSERPLTIKVICVLGFINAFLVGLFAMGLFAKGVDSWQVYFFALSSAIHFACAIGFWEMRRWAVFTYAAFSLLTQILLVAKGFWYPVSMILPIATNVIGFLFLSRMK